MKEGMKTNDVNTVRFVMITDLMIMQRETEDETV